MKIISRIVISLSTWLALFNPVSAEVPQTVKDYLNNVGNIPTEGLLPSRTAEGELFVTGVIEQWESIVSELKTIAPDSRRQCLIAIGAECLAPIDYLKFVEAISDEALKPDGGVKNQMISAIINASMVKDGFLAYHYQDVDVAKAIAKLKSAAFLKMPGKWNGFFAAVENGEAKAAVVARTQREGTELPEGLNDPSALDE